MGAGIGSQIFRAEVSFDLGVAGLDPPEIVTNAWSGRKFDGHEFLPSSPEGSAARLRRLDEVSNF